MMNTKLKAKNMQHLYAQIRQLKEENATLKLKNEALKLALKPLADIYVAYTKNNLDECRPEWGKPDDMQCELLTGRGGARLLTLAQCAEAQNTLLRKVYTQPKPETIDPCQHRTRRNPLT